VNHVVGRNSKPKIVTIHLDKYKQSRDGKHENTGTEKKKIIIVQKSENDGRHATKN
jgi:hypothetical protein